MANSNYVITCFQSDVYLIGKLMQKISGLVLPTTGDVLQIYFYYHNVDNLSQSSAVKAVMNNILEIWSKAHIPFTEKRNIVLKLAALLNDNIRVQHKFEIFYRESAFK